MALEDLVRDDAIRCALVGPSRVGKTSLVTAVIDDAQRMVQGRPVQVVPADGPTMESVNNSRDIMRGAIDAREFNPSALGSTGSPQLFNIALESSGHRHDSGVRISVLDSPGGWITHPAQIPPEMQGEWEFCQRFMAESTVLLVPIDATVLMEATTPKERASIRRILAISMVERVVTDWAKERARSQDRDEPAVLVLCPLKCESYFDDNGGHRDRSGELLRRVQAIYGEAMAIARTETRGRSLQILYSPIDTYGCVELVRAEWEPTFTARYRVRTGGKPSPLGAAPILQLFCQMLVETESDAERRHLAITREQLRSVTNELTRPRGFLARLAFKWSGDQMRVQVARSISQVNADALETRVAELNATVKEIASTEMGPRVAWL